jgi:hypothetical protein
VDICDNSAIEVRAVLGVEDDHLVELDSEVACEVTDDDFPVDGELNEGEEDEYDGESEDDCISVGGELVFEQCGGVLGRTTKSSVVSAPPIFAVLSGRRPYWGEPESADLGGGVSGPGGDILFVEDEVGLDITTLQFLGLQQSAEDQGRESAVCTGSVR